VPCCNDLPAAQTHTARIQRPLSLSWTCVTSLLQHAKGQTTPHFANPTFHWCCEMRGYDTVLFVVCWIGTGHRADWQHGCLHQTHTMQCKHFTWSLLWNLSIISWKYYKRRRQNANINIHGRKFRTTLWYPVCGQILHCMNKSEITTTHARLN
jgi:hypothetical protein